MYHHSDPAADDTQWIQRRQSRPGTTTGCHIAVATTGGVDSEHTIRATVSGGRVLEESQAGHTQHHSLQALPVEEGSNPDDDQPDAEHATDDPVESADVSLHTYCLGGPVQIGSGDTGVIAKGMAPECSTMENRSLDEFVDGDADEDQVRPASSTSRWDGSGIPCSACDSRVTRVWSGATGLVCGECKDWG